MTIQYLKKKFSILIYQDESAPRYFKINPLKARVYLFILPLITLLSLLAILTVGVYFKQIREYARKKEPEIFAQLRDKNEKLTQKVSEIETLNISLEDKLSKAGTSVTGSEDQGLESLSLFRIPPGLIDKSARPSFTIREKKIKYQNGRIKFTFNIHNESKNDEKLAGYFFVMMKSTKHVQIYPYAKSIDSLQFLYNQGEYFATTRFRPVVADFEAAPDEVKYLFKIIIFSRTGDLMYKLTQPMVIPDA